MNESENSFIHIKINIEASRGAIVYCKMELNVKFDYRAARVL